MGRALCISELLLYCVMSVCSTVPPVFQRVNGGPAAWELGEREEEEEMTDLREVVLSSPVSLSCESNAIPAPRLSWHRDGKEISNTDRVRLLPGEGRGRAGKCMACNASLFFA